MDATPDELIRPLGVEQEPERPSRLSARALAVGGTTLLILVLALAAGIAFLVDRRPPPSEPFALAPIGAREAPLATPAQPEAAKRNAGEIEAASGVAVIRPPAETAPDSVLIRIPEDSTLIPAPDPRLVERTRYGLLPKIGADGARPAQVYARPTTIKPGPRIAVVLSGLGISQSVTAEAIAMLPPAVTLAFAPHGSDLDQVARRAREDGHEVMLQLPMEPFDDPDNAPGPHTLAVRAKPQDNIERLQWVMGRFTGYTGLVTFMGAKLTADETALAPILKEVAGRGLIIVDDGSSPRSTIRPGPASLKAHAVIDAAPRADAIDRELRQLEELARERGGAIGSASATPLTVDRLARWAKTLEGRGIQLVPVSAMTESR